jgi:hypothetical protein
MEKSRFIEIGPVYYALAIISFFRSTRVVGSEEDIKQNFYDETEDYNYLEHEPLFERAVDWLISREMLDVERDDFGPPIYRAADQMRDQAEQLEEDSDSPFYKFALSGRSGRWLRKALENVNSTYEDLGLSPKDFENPDGEWIPLPLDREDVALRTAIETLDQTIEQVRSDNGYNATLPEERSYVLEGLSGASKTLKTAATTSAPYIQRYLLEPLAIVIKRFKNAAISVIATAAKDAIVEYLKKHGAEWLARIFG